MLKLCVVLTSRGNYAKFKVLMALAEADPDVELHVVVGGELVLKDRVVKEFDLPEHEKIYFSISGDTTGVMAKSTGNAVSEFSNYFVKVKPHVVAIVGDRFETLGVAVAAYLNNVPIAHLEGGEFSGGVDEGIRHSITKMANIHFPCTEKAVDVIKKLGENPDMIFRAGMTSVDAITTNHLQVSDFDQFQVSHGIGDDVNISNNFLLVVFHPVTNEDVNLQTIKLFSAMRYFQRPIIWVSPNIDAGSGAIRDIIRKFGRKTRIKFLKSLPIEYFGMLIERASCIIGNGSVGIREAAYFGTPNVSVGSRQDNRCTSHNTIHTTLDVADIIAATEKQIDHGRYDADGLYGGSREGSASKYILEILKKVDFNIQKVFYEYMGDCSCSCGKQGD
jgi:UDP-hydrolysing UDP-N-acetyl-D-glucosamine 2-epimerase